MAHTRSFAPAKPCESCGRSFRPRRDAVKKNRGRFCSLACWNSRPVFDRAKAIRLYQENWTLIEIAAKLGVGWQRIRRTVAAAGIPIRPASRRRMAHSRSRYRQIAATKIGRPLQEGETVHHINCDPTDNHPNNLLVLPSRTKHQLLHREIERLARRLIQGGHVLFT